MDPDGRSDIVDGDSPSRFTTVDRQTGRLISSPGLNYVEHDLQNYFITGNANYRDRLPDINCSPLAMSALEAEICEHYGIKSESVVPGISSKAMVGILTGGSIDIAGTAQKVSSSVVGKISSVASSAKTTKGLSVPSPLKNHSVQTGKVGSLSAKGEPNSSIDLYNKDGTLLQRRFYGNDGRASLDVDFSHGNGDGSHTFPHMHKWDWTKNPPRE